MSTEEKSTKKAGMTEPQKREAVALWKAGEATKTELARKYGVSLPTVTKLLKDKGVTDQKGALAAEIARKSEAAVTAALAIEPSLHAKRVFDTKNDSYRLIELVRKLVGKTIIEAQQQGKPLGTVANDIKTLREAAAALKTCREEAYALLGLSSDPVETEDDIPELKIQTLTEDQIKALQDAPLGAEIEEGVSEYEIPEVGTAADTDGSEDD